MELVKKHRCAGGEQRYYTHASKATGTPMRFSVFLPPQVEQGRVPALFFLSGLTCTEENVTTKAGFQRDAAELGLAVVAPDTSPRGLGLPGEDDSYDFGSGAGFYVDATREPWSKHYRMYTYVTKELPDLLLSSLPLDEAKLGVTGHSMGGHGALTVAFREPDRFKSVSAFSPIAHPSVVPWGKKAFTGYLGDDVEAWHRYDATELAKKTEFRGRVLVDQGTADEFLEEQLKPQDLVSACETKSIAIDLRMQPDYDHSYFFIATFMPDHLRHHAAQLRT